MGWNANQKRLLEAAERLAGVGTWAWSPDTGEVVWSPNMLRIFGLDPEAGTPSMERLVELVHPDDRELQAHEMERVRNGARDQDFHVRIVRPDGTLRHLDATIVETQGGNGRPRRVVGCVHDLTVRRLHEREIAAHLAVANALASSDSPDAGVEPLLHELGTALECERAVLWVPDEDALVARAGWTATEMATSEEQPAPDEALPRRPGPTVIAAIAKRAPVAANAPPTRGTLAFPALAGNELLATLELQSREPIELTEDFADSLLGIGQELGAYFAHHTPELRAPPLTPRELEVLHLAADGESGPEIADALEISPATVKTHFEHVYEKLGVSDRASAVAVALRRGIFE
ncbi:MAG: hypothetical protein QOI10_2206 [Solirubrobacterales bacterium]|jgi:PAS domain S-box-containing protein|nr:hypothetical protein [Solirubrobacterales bacterium]